MRSNRERISTYTGRWFWPLDPRAEEVDIRDIAHALSMQCRFTGHTRRFYSVAEHSVRVSRRVPAPDQLWALLHDASEAYLIDLARPVKHQPEMAVYRNAEKRIMRVVCERFALSEAQPPSVTEADHRMLVTEAHALMNYGRELTEAWSDLGEPYVEVIAGWDPKRAEHEFLVAFDEYTWRRDRADLATQAG